MKLTDKSMLSGNRRTFIKSAGVLALAAPVVVAGPPETMPEPSRWWHGRGRLQLQAEGVIPSLPVVPPIPWVLPPLTDPMPFPPGTEVRLRVAFPMPKSKNKLAVEIFAALPNPPGGSVPLSVLEVKITDVEVSGDPEPNLAMLGRVLVNDPAFLGDMTGAAFVLTTGFVPHENAPTDFILLGVHVAGHHTTIAPQGKGTMIIR